MGQEKENACPTATNKQKFGGFLRVHCYVGNRHHAERRDNLKMSKADTSKQQSTLFRFFTKAPTASAEQPGSKRANAESDVQQAIPSTLNACKRVISPRSPPSSPNRALEQVPPTCTPC